MGKLKHKSIGLLIIVFVFSSLACGASNSLPTRISTASVPTSSPIPITIIPSKTPQPTATFEVHQDIDSLVRRVFGLKLNTFDYEQYTYFEGQNNTDIWFGYHLDLSVIFPSDRSREEMLHLIYKLMSEIFYNFDESIIFVSANIRSHPDEIACVFGIGIGFLSVSQYLPSSQPRNLDLWFAALDSSDNYGDVPSGGEVSMAFANDPKYVPECNLNMWKELNFFS